MDQDYNCTRRTPPTACSTRAPEAVEGRRLPGVVRRPQLLRTIYYVLKYLHSDRVLLKLRKVLLSSEDHARKLPRIRLRISAEDIGYSGLRLLIT